MPKYQTRRTLRTRITEKKIPEAEILKIKILERMR